MEKKQGNRFSWENRDTIFSPALIAKIFPGRLPACTPVNDGRWSGGESSSEQAGQRIPTRWGNQSSAAVWTKSQQPRNIFSASVLSDAARWQSAYFSPEVPRQGWGAHPTCLLYDLCANDWYFAVMRSLYIFCEMVLCFFLVLNKHPEKLLSRFCPSKVRWNKSCECFFHICLTVGTQECK